MSKVPFIAFAPLTVAFLAVGALLAAPALAMAEPRVLSLEEALRIARAHQPQLQATRAQARQAGQRVGEARAAYLPRVDAQAQIQRATPNFLLSPMMLHTPLVKSYSAQNDLGLGDSVSYYVLGLSASQLIFDFGKTSAQIAQAEAGERMSDADAQAAAQATALNVRVAYFSVLAAKQLVTVGEETVQNQQKHVEQVRRFVKAGQRTRFDQSSVELNLADAQLAMVRAHNALRLAKLRLDTAIGLDSPTDYDVVEPAGSELAIQAVPATGLVEEAERHRPEMLRADAQVKAQLAARRAARAGYLPSLSALAGVSGAKVEGFGAGYDWFVGLGLTWNLFNGLYTTRQAAEARAGEAVAQAQRASVHLTIVADVEEQKLAIADAAARLALAESIVATAGDRLQQAEHRYETGAGDVLDLDDAQVALSNAKAQKVQDRYDLAIAGARLAHALGQE